MKLAGHLLGRPEVYRVWQRPFVDSKLAPLRRHCGDTVGIRVLDVGCGPGTNASYFGSTDYLGIDISPEYVASARSRYGARFEVVDVRDGDIPGPAEFDLILVNSLLHHVDTADARRILQRLSHRLARTGAIHVLDLVQPRDPGAARLLARWDRGSYPRPVEEWDDIFQEAFERVVFEPYAVPARGPTLWRMVYFQGRRRD